MGSIDFFCNIEVELDMTDGGEVINLHGSYVRNDGRAYKYYGRAFVGFPRHWEAHIWRASDTPHDVHKGFRAELSGELVNLEYSTEALRALATHEIESAIEAMPPV